MKRKILPWILLAVLLAGVSGTVLWLNRFRTFTADVTAIRVDTEEPQPVSVQLEMRRNFFTHALEFRGGAITLNGQTLPAAGLMEPYADTVSLIFRSDSATQVIPSDLVDFRSVPPTAEYELRLSYAPVRNQVSCTLYDWWVSAATDLDPFAFRSYATAYTIDPETAEEMFDLINGLRGRERPEKTKEADVR